MEDRLIKLLDFVEENINKNLTLDFISDYIGLSKYYLHHLFKEVSGLRVMDYIKNRILTKSAYELIDTDKRIIDIAFDFGFDYEESYIRSFKRAFGITPGKFRLKRPGIFIQDKLQNIKKTIFSYNDYLIRNPRIIYKPKHYLAGIEYEITHYDFGEINDNPELINDYFSCNSINDFFGYFVNIEEKKSMNYQFSKQISLNNDVSDKFEIKEVPSFKYVVFSREYIKRDSSYLKHVFRCFHRDWKLNSGYTRASKHYIETINSPSNDSKYHSVDVFFPIN